MNNSKNSVRTLTMLALLVAMSIVFSRVLSISTGFVRFNLGSLPVLLAALLFGPGAGFAVGAVCWFGGRYPHSRAVILWKTSIKKTEAVDIYTLRGNGGAGLDFDVHRIYQTG